MLIIDFIECLIAVCIARAISGLATLSWPLIAFLNTRLRIPAFVLTERLPGLVESRLDWVFYCLHGLLEDALCGSLQPFCEQRLKDFVPSVLKQFGWVLQVLQIECRPGISSVTR